jgi:ribosomal protein L35AE/L33A
MGTRKDRQRDKTRKRQKKNRDKARAARKARALQGKPTVARAKNWPLTEAWISEGWHEAGATVHAAVFRVHGTSGNAAAVYLEADLDIGTLEVHVEVGVPEGVAKNRLVEQAETLTYLETEPSQVARLLADMRALADREGHDLPHETADAIALLHDADPEDAPYDFALPEDLSDEPTDEVPVRSGGLVGTLKRLFGG